MTPNWKSAMLVLLVLYPTVMVLSRFFGPILDRVGAEPWLALWVSQIVSVSALQWWLMPTVTRPFRNWLDPGRRGSVADQCDRRGRGGRGIRRRRWRCSRRSNGCSSGTSPTDGSPRPRRDVLDRVGGVFRTAVAVQFGAHGVESGADVGITCDAEERGA